MSAKQVENMTEEFLESVRSMPQGQKIDQCLQCGTCTASCPSSFAMQYPPRAVLAALRAGMLDQVIRSHAVWLCASCYSCTVRCPAGIPLTEIMYEIKRFGIRKGLLDRKSNGVAMAETFVELIHKYGRSADAELIGRYILRTRPATAFSFIPLGWKLLRKNRISFGKDQVAGIAQLRKMLAAMEKGQSL